MSQIPSGYLVGRALVQLGPGPWWEYVAIAPTLEGAVARATTLAQQAHAHAWPHDRADEYSLLY